MRYVLRICVLTFPDFGAKLMPTKAQSQKGENQMKLSKAQICLINKIINAKLSSKEVAEIRDYIERIKGKTPDYDNEEE